MSTRPYAIVRKAGTVRTAYDASNLVSGIRMARGLAKEHHKTYDVSYAASLAPIVGVGSDGKLKWY